MTGPGKLRTCSHPINTLMLTGVRQVVRMFSPCQFQVYISIGTLESDLLSQSTPCETKCTMLIASNYKISMSHPHWHCIALG